MQVVRTTALGLAVLAVAGCAAVGSPTAPVEAADAAVQGTDASRPAPDNLPVGWAWQPLGTWPVDAAGRTQAIPVPASAPGRFFAVRVRPQPARASEKVCYQVEDVRGADGTSWVAPWTSGNDRGQTCADCTQRVQIGHDFGLFVFPNDGVPGPAAAPASMRVRLLDCALGISVDAKHYPEMPPAVAVELASEPMPAPGNQAHLALRVGVAPGTHFDPASTQGEALLTQALARVASLYALGGVEVHVDAIVGLPPNAAWSGPVIAGPGQMAAANAVQVAAVPLLQAANTQEIQPFVPVLALPCVVYKRPLPDPGELPMLGWTPRIPGGLGPNSTANAVLFTAGDCPGGGTGQASPPDGDRAGAIIAHEIGHFLGLYHAGSAEASHRAAAGPVNLMAPMASLPAGPVDPFSPAQWDVVRRHPLIRYQAKPAK